MLKQVNSVVSRNYLNSKIKYVLGTAVLVQMIKYIWEFLVQGICRIRLVSGFNLEVEVLPQYLYVLMTFLKLQTGLQFRLLCDLICYNKKSQNNFMLVYSLLSIHRNLRINVFTNCSSEIISCQGLFLSSYWLEREVFEFFGLFFLTHSDLRRLLLDYGFIGFPLRKDFPVTGFVEIFFDENQDRICFRSLGLAQE